MWSNSHGGFVLQIFRVHIVSQMNSPGEFVATNYQKAGMAAALSTYCAMQTSRETICIKRRKDLTEKGDAGDVSLLTFARWRYNIYNITSL